jgi:hypothetical protein
MKKMFLVAAIAAATAGSGAGAAELPSFELRGFPITRVQVSVMGAANVQEQSPAATLMFGGMPASPHQIAALTSRPEMAATAAVKRTTIGLVAE